MRDDETTSPPPLFDPSVLLRHLEGRHVDLRSQVLEAMAKPELAIPRPIEPERYREEVLKAVGHLAERGWGAMAYPPELGGGGDTAAAVKIFETLAYGDLSVVVKFGVQFGLFGGSVLQLGSDLHRKTHLSEIGTLELPGCFAMTERDHGSNVRDIRTRATYDSSAQTFEIHTPDPGAVKDWIGNAALHGKMATVFARLHTQGADQGVHAFLVPLRNERGRTLEGVEIRDRGDKVGLNGVDNGTIRFTRVRVPRSALLDRFAQVAPDGTYESSIPDPGRRFFTMLGTLVSGRISIAAASVSASKTSLATALRYGSRRTQFGPAGEPEIPLLDYRAHQRLLLPRLAATYGLHFAVWKVVDDLTRNGASPSSEIEVRAAALKAYASRHAVETIQSCREACGGEGYSAINRFGELRDDVDIFTTFEGANPVLLQLVAKGLLTEYRDQMGDLRFWGVVQQMVRLTGSRIQQANPIASRRTEEAHLRDVSFHAEMFQLREKRLTHSLALRLRERISNGMNAFHAVNECQDHLLTLGEAHAERLVLDAFHEGVARAPTPGVSEVLGELARLHALSTLERHAGWYLEHGVMEGGKTKAIRALVNRLCGEVREKVPFLVDAFGIPDDVLAAPAGIGERGAVSFPRDWRRRSSARPGA